MEFSVGEFNRNPSQHFAQRCQERGIVRSNVWELFNGMAWAVYSGRDDLCEHVKTDSTTGTIFYRFRSLDGIVYAPMKVSKCGRRYPATIFTQSEWRNTRRAIRRRLQAARCQKQETTT